MSSKNQTSLFVPGDTCWRVARADRLSLIVDAAPYFKVLRAVMSAAKRELLLIGWDFDFEIEMLPGESDADGLAPDGMPNRLGDFIEFVVQETPTLEIYILKWNGAMVVAPGRLIPTLKLRAFGDDRIHFALDGHHPFGACHHQKIVVADDTFAFCGGIDATESRWDTSDHLPDDPRRVLKDGSPAPPWHDATAAMTGPVAAALAELSRNRWQRANGEDIERPENLDPIDWPDQLTVTAEDVDIAIARTAPPFDGDPLINEIEELCLAAIESAKDIIYIESQYFAAESVCDALEGRLRDPDGPEIVIINPESALSETEDKAMHVLRGRMTRRLRKVDLNGRFRIFYPADASGGPIYVHAKILIVDDRLLRIGSSNLNDRSHGFDTECDIAFEEPQDKGAVIAGFRRRLMAEHLGTTPDAVKEAREKAGSLIGAINALNVSDGRGLRPIEQMPEGVIGKFLADTRLLDQRYKPGRSATAGQGVRPRHIAALLGVAGLAVVGWRLWRGQSRNRKTPPE